MKATPKIIYLLMLAGMTLPVSCKKQDDFLNEKPQSSLSTITSLADCQSILNNEGLFNRLSSPSVGENTTDEFYITTASYNSFRLTAWLRNAYIFAKDIFSVSDGTPEWGGEYNVVYTANIVLDALSTIKIDASQQALYNKLKGSAIFYRSVAFYNLVQTYALPYDSASASGTLGIPLRLSSDLNDKSVRVSEKDCYDQILGDLQTALQLVPAISQYLTQPNKTTVNAMLARVYLGMGNYPKAFQYADATLSLYNQLTDYNNLVSNAPNLALAIASQYPLVEDIYSSIPNEPLGARLTLGIVDSTLYSLYDSTDLRKSLYFTNFSGALRYIGCYEILNPGYAFDGLATDEIYLIRAEASARLGNTAAAMADLNTLLVNRYKTGTFSNRTAVSSNDALVQILLERRKELCFRGLRWTDLRRLNKEPQFAVTVTHIINGVAYTLPPNDPRYAISIPVAEIALSGIQQNPR